MRVLLATRYGRLGASSRLRAYQYLPYLRSQGFDVAVAPFFSDSYQQDLYLGHGKRWGQIAYAYLVRLAQMLTARSFDLLWIEYELFPWLPGAGEWALNVLGMPFVVDYDDAIFHRYDSHRNPVVRLLLGRKIDRVMRRASTVIVANHYILNRARSAGAKRIEYLPTVVDLTRYTSRVRKSEEPFTIGWIGSPSTAPYLQAVAPVLADFCRAHKARLLLIGVRGFSLSGVPVETRPWSESAEVADIQECDVGIMPVPDAPWERGKSGYKLIQYMACGLPVIASPVGVNSQLVQSGINGYIADTPTQWGDALQSLLDSPSLRAQMGAAGRRVVEASYTTDVTAPRLASILAESTTPYGDRA